MGNFSSKEPFNLTEFLSRTDFPAASNRKRKMTWQNNTRPEAAATGSTASTADEAKPESDDK